MNTVSTDIDSLKSLLLAEDHNKIEAARLVKKIREGLNMTVTEFAGRMAVALNTAYRWERLGNVPRIRISGFERLASIASSGDSVVEQAGDTKLAIFTPDEVVEMEGDCKQVWHISYLEAFGVLLGGGVRISNQLKRTEDIEHHFVYLNQIPRGIGVTAQQSYEFFNKNLKKSLPQHASRVHGHALCHDSDDANVLSFPTHPEMTVQVLSEGKWEETGTSTRLFVKLPVMQLQSPEYREAAPYEQLAVFQYAPKETDVIWRRISPIFERLSTQG